MFRTKMEHQHENECNFGKRVWALPIVKSAAKLALSMYTQAKDYNSVSNTTFNKAEKTISSLTTYAKPLLNKIETPLNVANNVACATLSMLEEKAPVITMAPEDIGAKAKKALEDAFKPAVDYYRNALTYGTDTLNSAKNYGITKANKVLETPVAKKVQVSLDELISWADQKVDTKLPASESEGDEAKPLTGNVLQKATILSWKITRRLRHKADDRVTYLKTYLKDLRNTDVPTLLQTLKKQVDTTKDTLVIKAKEVLVVPSPAELRDKYNKLRSHKIELPEGVKVTVEASKIYAGKLYEPIGKANTWSEVSDAVSKDLVVVLEDLLYLGQQTYQKLMGPVPVIKVDQSTTANENSHN